MPTRTLLATFPLLLAALSAQEKFTLRYAFQPGTFSWTQLDVEMSQEIHSDGKKTTTGMGTSVWMENKVAGVDKGTAAISSRYARVKLKGNVVDPNVDYDSDVAGSSAGPLAMVTNLVGKTATMQVDAHGKVTAIEMPKDLGAFEQIAESLKTGMEQSFVSWPEGPIAIGETWQTKLDIPMQQLGTMTATVTNKLLAVEGDMVKLALTMAFDISRLQAPGGMALKMKDTISSMTVDLKSPMPIESSMAMTMEMSMNGSVFMAVTMKQTTKRVPAPAPKTEPKKEQAGQ